MSSYKLCQKKQKNKHTYTTQKSHFFLPSLQHTIYTPYIYKFKNPFTAVTQCYCKDDQQQTDDTTQCTVWKG